jgi:hypothetical protein
MPCVRPGLDWRRHRSRRSASAGQLEIVDKDAQALLLLTNRILLDYLSIKVSDGSYDRGAVEKLISFSESEVLRGAPWVEAEVRQFAQLFRDRLAPGPDEPAGD